MKMNNKLRVELQDIQDHPAVTSYESHKYYDEDIGMTTITHTFVIDEVEFNGLELSYLDYISIYEWNSDELNQIKEILKKNNIPFEIV